MPPALVMVLALAIQAAESPGCPTDYIALKNAEMAEISSARSLIQRIIRDDLTDDDLNEQELAILARVEAIQESRKRPVDQADLDILIRANALLTTPDVWDRQDDRNCAGDERLSLYCALERASIEILGHYEHRRTALQEVRFAIEEVSSGRTFAHRMQDFNNSDQTRFADLKQVLAVAIERVADRLERQAACAL